MTELLCIETSPSRLVIAGNIYFGNEIITPCRCKAKCIDVGILDPDHTGKPYQRCINCGDIWPTRPNDKYRWFKPSRFAQIGTTDECEQYSEPEKVRVEK